MLRRRPTRPISTAIALESVIRQTVLTGLTDPFSEIRLAVVTAALANMDTSDSTSLYQDINVLRKVAIKIERAYGLNDAALVAALDPVITVVEGNLQALRVRIATVTSPKLNAKVTALADSAATLVTAAKTPRKKKLNNVGARSTALRDAQKAIDTANAKIDHAASGGSCRNGGRVTASIDGVSFTPTYATVQKVVDANNVLQTVQVSGYYYDQAAPNPYAQGTMDLLWTAATFTGAGTYTLTDNSTPTVLSQQAGDLFHATSGTITLTTYDEAGQLAEGTFECTLTNSGGSVTKVVTSGSFRVCRFVTLQ